MTTTLTGRPRKILEALYVLSPNGPRLVTYEDIVVKAWELYPDDFGLRGYSDRYPDASDIHVPLYKELRSNGFVTSGPTRQKKFKLTPTGWERARDMFSGDRSNALVRGRMSRAAAEEIRHIERATATRLLAAGAADEVLDTDFFTFYRTSVRAPSREFQSRLAQTRDAIEEALAKRTSNAEQLRQVDEFLRNKFSQVIAVKGSNRGDANHD